jgi:predicted transcriptional regulator
MIEKRIKRLVVADVQNRLLGMIDRESILRAFANGEK